jgi:hypothetical protein
MTSLTTSALLLSAISAAGSIPILLLAVPAGTLGDLVDRRRLILFSQAGMLFAAVARAVLASAGALTLGVLLALLFMIGIGGAASAPTWQTLQPELVPATDRPQAIALGSVNQNLARAVLQASRDWAQRFPHRYRLIFESTYGSGALEPERTIPAAHRAMTVILAALADLGPTDRAPTVTDTVLVRQLTAWGNPPGQDPLKPGVLLLGLTAWTRLHGIISVESCARISGTSKGCACWMSAAAEGC